MKCVLPSKVQTTMTQGSKFVGTSVTFSKNMGEEEAHKRSKAIAPMIAKVPRNHIMIFGSLNSQMRITQSKGESNLDDEPTQ